MSRVPGILRSISPGVSLCVRCTDLRFGGSLRKSACGFRVLLLLIVCLSTTVVFSQDDTAQNLAENSVEPNLEWKFASVEQGQALLATEDDFIQRLSPFDRSARLKTSKAVSKAEHLEFVTECVRPWEREDRELLLPALQQAKKRLAEIRLPVPSEILLIRTNGKEEGQAPYTRGNAIILPANRLASESPKSLKSLLFHELFHIASRTDHTLRDKLYKVIGFEGCGELSFPSTLSHRKLTNPDAPVLQHCIRVTVGGTQQWVVPVIYAASEKYDEKRGGEFFEYLKFDLLVVQRDSATGKLLANQGSQPVFVSPRTAKGFMEQIGANTRYIIHPEEILADNFALFASGDGKIQSPRIIERMQAILQSHR